MFSLFLFLGLILLKGPYFYFVTGCASNPYDLNIKELVGKFQSSLGVSEPDDDFSNLELCSQVSSEKCSGCRMGICMPNRRLILNDGSLWDEPFAALKSSQQSSIKNFNHTQPSSNDYHSPMNDVEYEGPIKCAKLEKDIVDHDSKSKPTILTDQLDNSLNIPTTIQSKVNIKDTNEMNDSVERDPPCLEKALNEEEGEYDHTQTKVTLPINQSYDSSIPSNQVSSTILFKSVVKAKKVRRKVVVAKKNVPLKEKDGLNVSKDNDFFTEWSQQQYVPNPNSVYELVPIQLTFQEGVKFLPGPNRSYVIFRNKGLTSSITFRSQGSIVLSYTVGLYTYFMKSPKQMFDVIGPRILILGEIGFIVYSKTLFPKAYAYSLWQVLTRGTTDLSSKYHFLANEILAIIQVSKTNTLYLF